MQSPRRASRYDMVRRGAIGLAVFALVMTVSSTSFAASTTRTVPADRWARSVCAAWLDYADGMDRAYFEFDDLLHGLQKERVTAVSAREQLLEVSARRVAIAIDALVAIDGLGAPSVDKGAALASSYRSTVMAYVLADVRAMTSLARLEASRGAVLTKHVRAIDDDRWAEWIRIDYVPIEELRTDARIADAVNRATECGDLVSSYEMEDSGFAVGECVALTNGATFDDFWLTDLVTIDCAQPHIAEFFFVADYPAEPAAPFPGTAIIDGYATAQCSGDPFTQYVGVPYDDSPLDYVWFVPIDQLWNYGMREIVCVAVDPDGALLTGTVRGTGGASTATA